MLKFCCYGLTILTSINIVINIQGLSVFKNSIIKFIGTVHDHRRIKLKIRKCGLEVDWALYYNLSHSVTLCPLSHVEWWKIYPLEHDKSIDCRLLNLTEIVLIKALLFGYYSADAYLNTLVLNATIEQILITKRSDESLFRS